MNDTTGPGAPRTDEMARNAALHNLTNQAEMFVDRHAALGSGGAQHVADWILQGHTVTWETDVNANGVPVRRYVMRGEWEVDSVALTDLPRPGDLVAYPENLDAEIHTINHGVIPPGQEWIVRPEIEVGDIVDVGLGFFTALNMKPTDLPEHGWVVKFLNVTAMNGALKNERLACLGRFDWAPHKWGVAARLDDLTVTGHATQIGVYCADQDCDDYGSTDMGGGNCPAEHGKPIWGEPIWGEVGK